MRRASPLLLSFALCLTTLLHAAPAVAALDLTGDWRATLLPTSGRLCDALPPPGPRGVYVFNGSIAQSGSSATLRDMFFDTTLSGSIGREDTLDIPEQIAWSQDRVTVSIEAALDIEAWSELSGAGTMSTSASADVCKFSYQATKDDLSDFWVTRSEDAIDTNVGNGVCDVSGVAIPTSATCTLRAALQEANHRGAAHTLVSMEAGIYEFHRLGINEDAGLEGDLDVTGNITLAGDGADPEDTVIDANGYDRAIEVHEGATLVLRNVQVQDGGANSDSGSFSYAGGGILVKGGYVTLEDCIVVNNVANVGGGIYVTDPLGTGVGGELYMNDCTVANNRANDIGITNADGGGVNGGRDAFIHISNSTFVGNFAASGTFGGGGGGAVRGNNADTIIIENSTFTQNSGSPAIGSLNTEMVLGNVTIAENGHYGISFGACDGCGHLTVANSIVADNTGGDCSYSSSRATSEGYNLSSDASCSFYAAGDLQNREPRLEALADNGGLSETMAPARKSPVIDKGNPGGCRGADGNLLLSDQTGGPRSVDRDGDGVARCDMGAVEYVPEPGAGALGAFALCCLAAMARLQPLGARIDHR